MVDTKQQKVEKEMHLDSTDNISGKSGKYMPHYILSYSPSWIVLCLRYSFYCFRQPLDIGDIHVNEAILGADLSPKEESKLDSTRLIDLIYSSSILSHGQKISILSSYEIDHCDTSNGNTKITSFSVILHK